MKSLPFPVSDLPTPSMEKQDGEGSPPSFSSMIQDPKSQVKASPERQRRSPSSEPNFEFGRVNSSPPSPADVLFSDGQLIPTNSSPNNPSSRRTSNSSNTRGNSTGGIKSCLRESSSNSERRRRSAEAAVPKRVSFRALPAEQKPSTSQHGRNTVRRSAPASARVARKVGNMATKRGSEKKQGLFGSFLLACRECHALEPSKHVSERIIAA